MTETVSQVGLGSADCTPLPRSSPLRRGLQNSREYCMRLKLLHCITGSNMLACKRDNLSTMKQHDMVSCKPWLCLELPVCVMSTSNARDAPWRKMLKKKKKFQTKLKIPTRRAVQRRLERWRCGRFLCGIFALRTHLCVYKNTRPRAKSIRCLQLGAQDDKVCIFFFIYIKNKTKQQP